MTSRSKLVAGVLGLALAGAVAPVYAWGLDSLKSVDLNKVGNLFSSAKDSLGKSEQEETELGREVAARIVGAWAPVADEKVQHYVNSVGRWISLQSERPDLSWHFAVVESDAVNAYATPGGYVFLTKGLFLKLRSESELAGVLAHEIAHVVEKHHLNAIQKGGLIGLVSGAASIAADQSQSEHAAQVDKLASAGTELYARGLDKEDEFDADAKGVVLAARAGYDPYALLAVLQTLAAADPKDAALALMFKTHPSPDDRLARVGPLVDEYLADYGDQPQVAERFQRVRARLVPKK